MNKREGFKVGDAVVFHPKVWGPNYAPYYDEYQGETFEIVAFHHEVDEDDPSYTWPPHVELKCTSLPELKVKGYVHLDELEAV